MRSDLPAALKAALARAAFGVSRVEAARRAAALSDTYRAGGGSQAITDGGGALAYALARMPATYAAVAACLDAVRAARPDFAPHGLIDVGAGPGTASWAAASACPELEAFMLLDTNAALRSLALTLAEGSDRLAGAAYRLGEARTELAAAAPGDLVIASYVIAELADPAPLVARMWEKTGDVLLIVEPGTPDGTRRVLAARAQVIALGGHVVAPCPHDAACPLTPPDWCHFSQRLARSRDHKQVKRADAPFEDEKFAYVALSRRAGLRPARVLSPPAVGKAAVALRLCTPAGRVAAVTVPRRDRPAYAQARRLRWGDGVPADTAPSADPVPCG
jgi:ribosomal protein RSM22 (predicted rRNA methylase)